MSSFLIVNAKLKRIDRVTGASATGTRTYSTGAAIDVGVTLDQPNRSQRWALGAKIEDATAVLYCMLKDLSNTVVGAGSRVSVSLVIGGVEQAAVLYEVVYEIPRIHDPLSHVELYLKEVDA